MGSESLLFDIHSSSTPGGWTEVYNEDQFLNKIDNAEGLYVQQFIKLQKTESSNSPVAERIDDDAGRTLELQSVELSCDIESDTVCNNSNIADQVDLDIENAAVDENTYRW